jgi:hypothetical protein
MTIDCRTGATLHSIHSPHLEMTIDCRVGATSHSTGIFDPTIDLSVGEPLEGKVKLVIDLHLGESPALKADNRFVEPEVGST